jgi:hypothetical protein
MGESWETLYASSELEDLFSQEITVQEPKRLSDISIKTADKASGMIYFYSTAELSKKTEKFGLLNSYPCDFYGLQVDHRYDFDEVLEFIENLIHSTEVENDNQRNRSST